VTREMLSRDDALRACDMRQHQLAGDITDRVDAPNVGPHGLIYDDEPTFVRLYAGRVQSDRVGVGLNADRNQRHIRFERLALAGGLVGQAHGDARVGRLDALGLRVDQHLDARTLELLGCLGGGFFVFERKDVGQHLDDGHICAVGAEDIGEFHADRTRANHHEPLGNGREFQRLAIRDHLLPIDGHARQVARPRTRRYDDRLGLDHLAARLDRYLVLAGELSRALHMRHLVLAEEEADALDQTVGDLPAPLLCGGVVELQIVEAEAEILALIRQDAGQFGIAQQRLGGNAAPVEAYPAKVLALHARHRLAELSRPDRRDIAARPTANYYDIV